MGYVRIVLALSDAVEFSRTVTIYVVILPIHLTISWNAYYTVLRYHLDLGEIEEPAAHDRHT